MAYPFFCRYNLNIKPKRVGSVVFGYPLATQNYAYNYICKQRNKRAKYIMAARKEIRSDNTYIISTDNTENPKLGAKILSNGRESLFLDYYLGYQMAYSEKLDKQVAKKERKREFLTRN